VARFIFNTLKSGFIASVFQLGKVNSSTIFFKRYLIAYIFKYLPNNRAQFSVFKLRGFSTSANAYKNKQQLGILKLDRSQLIENHYLPD